MAIRQNPVLKAINPHARAIGKVCSYFMDMMSGRDHRHQISIIVAIQVSTMMLKILTRTLLRSLCASLNIGESISNHVVVNALRKFRCDTESTVTLIKVS